MVESSLSEISSETIRSAVQETIVKYLQTDKVEISVGAASKTGDNFIGELLHRNSSFSVNLM